MKTIILAACLILSVNTQAQEEKKILLEKMMALKNIPTLPAVPAGALNLMESDIEPLSLHPLCYRQGIKASSTTFYSRTSRRGIVIRKL